jgi:TRAP-type C4-dicarboxylate transport system permease small subunit
MNQLKWIEKNIERVVLMVMLLAIIIILTYSVIMRYVFNNPPVWTNNLAQYCFATSVFFSIGYCIRKRKVLRIDNLLSIMPKNLKFGIIIFNCLIAILFYFFLTIVSFRVFESFRQGGQVDVAMQMPMYIFYSVVFIGFGLATIRSIQDLMIELKERNKSDKGVIV